MSDRDSGIALDDTLTAAELIRAVMAQKEPTDFEVALVGYIEHLEDRLEAALNDLTALHAGSKRRLVVNDPDNASTQAVKIKVHVEGEDEIVTLH